MVDLRQKKVVKKLQTEKKPDGNASAAPFHKLYVSGERGKAEVIVDVAKDEVIKTLHFDSETGMPQYDPVARKVVRQPLSTAGGNPYRPRGAHRGLCGQDWEKGPRPFFPWRAGARRTRS